MENILNKFFDKVPILKYILTSFAKWLIIGIATFGILFVVLSLTGVYDKLVSTLDLKYNSPFVLIPLFASITLAVLCFFVGFLMYFHKYKRSKLRSKFNNSFSNILGGAQVKSGSERAGVKHER